MTLQLLTNSALADKIKASWRMVKTEEFPIPGDYYYNQIDIGILYRKQIEIKSEHLPFELLEYIGTQNTMTVKRILQRCILEIFAEKFGGGLAKQSIIENRIRVRYD